MGRLFMFALKFSIRFLILVCSLTTDSLDEPERSDSDTICFIVADQPEIVSV